jgi:hypothetical protein
LNLPAASPTWTHLAPALALGNDLATVITYDQRMATAAIALGLQVVAPA